jgi:phosphoglycerol transferase MdoB-like AlkP superfamily enzyme
MLGASEGNRGIPMQKWIRAFAILLGVLVISLPVLPLLAFALNSVLPHRIEDFMFFWPQYVLVPRGFRTSPPAYTTVLSDWSMELAIAFWVAFLALVAMLVRRWSAKWIVLASLPIALVTVALSGEVLGAFEFWVALDGP